ncbi:hypothetical protein [Acidomonas methanolica]|uniref:Uncharacterized protein n=1 Tax=Acidomonas methanolica NBRC 104435 TaxID=1231351 RepID=A0A023D6G3_ACIMT|nr:hypothetical protein [Acidomonas methanolica]MBU2655083.1 hypothetical protein [Acidomonas methanolica]TCS29493.1 hypothetical protein EDC31_10662 [Acidomonas methanolica]GAJ29335.1 hypothetical protein Amme_059_054 [Acidomonas methanolica NBRC 104435]GBQ45519.1 hypothetical protein AA0498_0070 [Acidomonas methanolica]GEK99099.1 hypothetical protein AME01nite_15980 [Acidomonas methanolica NBRC 104435]
MGWYFSLQSKAALVRELTQSTTTDRAIVEVLDHTLSDTVLWSVVKVTARTEGVHPHLKPGESLTYIRCDLLDQSGKMWGHKPLEEAMHPYYYSCPLSYLDLAPEQSSEWRAGVHAWHARHGHLAPT